jgi:hypothetical protein
MKSNQLPFGRSGRHALAITILVIAALPLTGVGQFEISTATGSTSQNFDTLTTDSTANWLNDSTLADDPLNPPTLPGWSLFTFANTPITTYRSGIGDSNTGSFYSFGVAGNGDRSLGGTASGGAYFGSPATGAVAGYIAFSATNTSSATLTGFTLGFDGEQWRNGGNTSAQTMVLEYGFGATFTDVTWVAPGGNFDWSSPVVGSTASPVIGNDAGLVANRGGSISGLDWTTGTTLWLRWTERNDAGNDHGLGIDKF